MKKLFILLAFASAITSQAVTINPDPIGDIHYEGDQISCLGMSTDIVRTEIKTVCENSNENCQSHYSVTITLSENFRTNRGYREYYFWVDVDPDKKIGYQPYNPYDVAWPDLYADYRFMFTVNANHDRFYEIPSLKVQNCSRVNCAQDEGMQNYKDLDLQIEGKNITFKWPIGMISKLEKSRHWKVGFTTYQESEDGTCSGEDDAPQWGRKAYNFRY